MRGSSFQTAATLVAAAFLCGCQVEPDVTQAPVRNTYSFQGKVDPRFVGEWRTNPSPSALTLRKDGSVGIVAVAHGQGGTVITKLEGSWLVSDNDLLIRYRRKGDADDTVLKYSAKLSGSTLNVVQAGSGLKSTYKRGK